MRKDPDYSKKYYVANKPRIASRKRWRQKYDLDYRLSAVLKTIIQRCNDSRHATYKFYGGKGVQNFLTLNDLKTLWVRDNANKMNRPSIDRVDSDLHYTFTNCRFIEHAENIRRGVVVREARKAQRLLDTAAEQKAVG